MSIEKAIYDGLSADVALTALIGGRVYAVDAPQEAELPHIVYFKVSPGRQYTHDGDSNLQTPRIQVSCYSETYEGVKGIVEKVIKALYGLPATNANVQAVFVEGEQDMFDYDTSEYHVPVDFIIHYREV